MEPAKLTSGKSADNNAAYQTDSVTPTPGALVLIFVASAAQLPVTPVTPTVSGNGLAWRMDQTVLGGAGNDRRLTCFTAMGPTPTAGRINIDFADEVQDLIQWSVMEFTGVNTSGAAGVGAIAQRTNGTGTGAGVSLTLGPLADANRNATVGAVMLDITFTDADRPVTPGAGFTEVDEVTDRQVLGRGASLQTQAAGTGRTTVSWTWNGPENSAALALEVKAKPLPESGGGVVPPADRNEALIKRFEPVLFLHPQEAFVPSDAKRYIENAAMWSAKGSFDDKNQWAPLVTKTNLVAVRSELTPTKKYLGEPGLLTATANEVRFLELGEWKDKDANHEAGVTDSTTNLYADRAAIAGAYRGALEPSRFWYHAEVYEHARLVGLASNVKAPNLSRIVAKYPDALLLCYYFFFPAHEQSVGREACSNVEAKELACHAGDWQCVALLLTGDGSGTTTSYTPEFFGYTGLRPEGADTKGVRYSGDEDLGGYTVMKVEPWRSGSVASGVAPELVGDHPCFYVARGSHSLYTTAGVHEVDPEPNASLGSVACGRLDTPALVSNDGGTPGHYLLEAFAALFLKMLAGGLFGNAFAGLVAADVEAFTEGPFGARPQRDAPNPDATPTVGTAMTIKPVGVTVPNTGAQAHDWRVQNGLQIGGRTYDYVVNRSTQIWWPSDDLRNGYRGRWGQHVAADPMDRRNGPQFLQFWKMFLTAMAGRDR